MRLKYNKYNKNKDAIKVLLIKAHKLAFVLVYKNNLVIKVIAYNGTYVKKNIFLEKPAISILYRLMTDGLFDSNLSLSELPYHCFFFRLQAQQDAGAVEVEDQPNPVKPKNKNLPNNSKC